MRYQICLLVVSVLILSLIGGCAGVATNAAVTAEFSDGATIANSNLQAAQNGTLPIPTAMSLCVDVGERFKVAQANMATSWQYIVDNKDKGLLILDQNYVPRFSFVCADALAVEDLCQGAWASNPPTQALANQAAAQSLKSVQVVNAMIQDTTLQTVSRKKLALKKLKAATLTVPAIISAIPGAATVWNDLTPAEQAEAEADAAIVATWGQGQIAAWWANVTSGQTIAALRSTRGAVTPTALLAVQATDNTAAIAAISLHVSQQLTLVSMLNQIGADLVAAIPLILSFADKK